MARRTVGIHGTNLETKKNQNVQPADFSVCGMIGRFQRMYNKTFSLKNSDLLDVIFGEGIKQWYGHDAALGFFANSDGGTLFIKSHAGNDGSDIDAVVASATIVDQNGSPASTIQMQAAYKGGIEEGALQYGTFGNLIARKITNGNRYVTTAAATALAAATQATVRAIGDIKVGDLVRFKLSGGYSDSDSDSDNDFVSVYKKITEIDETLQVIKWSGALNAGSETLAVDDDIEVLGFKIQTYLKNSKGIITEVEQTLGKTWCTMEPEVVEYYVENVHKENSYAKYTDLSSASTLQLSFPANDSTYIFMTGGTNGTAPSTVAHWDFNLSAFNNDPVFLMTNPDTTLKDHFDNMETYNLERTRSDFPICLPNAAVNLSSTSLENLYRSYQRSRFRLMVNCFTWYQKVDQFNNSPIAPKREIPPVGHNMGAWIRSAKNFGIHQGPAIDEIEIFGVTGVVGHQSFDDEVRTLLIDAGGNISQVVDGAVKIRNWVTPSTLVEWLFGHTLLQRNFYRESVKQSMTRKQNEPNVFRRIQRGRDAIYLFMATQFRQGSNGRVEEGETFGQQQKADGNLETMDECFEVISDPTINSADQLINGSRDYDIRFKTVAETLDIYINVGVILRS